MTFPFVSARGPRRLGRAVLAAFVASVLLIAPAAAEEEQDLDQTLDALEIVHGDRVLAAGHIDMGPKFDDGQWRFLIHDDVAKADARATSVWRYPAETAFHVLDAAILAVPDDPQYAFLGADPGSDVYVIPQTQYPEVVWLGWNTQDPEVMGAIDRGITLTFRGMEGPGGLTVYLQSGSFGEPEVLWDSRIPEEQSIWVDVNTHTHANWVFTAPGVYRVEVTASAALIDGTEVSDTQVLQFAVGTGTDPQGALDEAGSSRGRGDSAAAEPSENAQTSADTGQPSAGEQTASPLVPVLIGAIAFVVVAIVLTGVVIVVRGKRLRREALRSASAADDDERNA